MFQSEIVARRKLFLKAFNQGKDKFTKWHIGLGDIFFPAICFPLDNRDRGPKKLCYETEHDKEDRRPATFQVSGSFEQKKINR